MKEIKFYEQPVYVWECPKCGHFNEDTEDPEYMDTVVCDECHNEFKPIPE